MQILKSWVQGDLKLRNLPPNKKGWFEELLVTSYTMTKYHHAKTENKKKAHVYFTLQKLG